MAATMLLENDLEIISFFQKQSSLLMHAGLSNKVQYLIVKQYNYSMLVIKSDTLINQDGKGILNFYQLDQKIKNDSPVIKLDQVLLIIAEQLFKDNHLMIITKRQNQLH
jgi:hypothetical protein